MATGLAPVLSIYLLLWVAQLFKMWYNKHVPVKAAIKIQIQLPRVAQLEFEHLL